MNLLDYFHLNNRKQCRTVTFQSSGMHCMCDNSWQHAKWYLKDSDRWRKKKRFSSVRDKNCTHHARLSQVMPSYSKAWWLWHQAMCFSKTFIPWNKQESPAYLNSATVCAAGCYWDEYEHPFFFLNKKTELRVQSSTIVLLSAYFSTVGKLFHLMWLLVDFLFLCHPDLPHMQSTKNKTQCWRRSDCPQPTARFSDVDPVRVGNAGDSEDVRS